MGAQIELTSKSKSSNYAIVIDQDFASLTELIPDNASQILILSDSNVVPLYYDTVAALLSIKPHLIQIDSGEEHKNLSTVEAIWQQLNDVEADRNAVLINLGGGVITDLGGFAAATYKRGISFVNIPTTLLAQVDAATGGKTGVNFAGLKNNVGTFTPPIGVYCNTACLSTLSDRVFAEGFGEIIKHAMISVNTILHDLKEKNYHKNDAEKLAELVAKSVQVKVDVVALDERESSLRKILNFGHTFGHALESLSHKSDDPLLHGEAVGLGMIGELYAAKNQELLEVVIDLLKKFNLPTKLKRSIDWSDFQDILVGDKKNYSGEIQWAIPFELGKTKYDFKLEEPTVRAALDWMQGL